ncbi:MAG: hypothetical protein KGI06_05350 [Candidatus Micrarchaeota archaeon]|nr:hypothetical protein [Candidatus Micrarchaeota archaeon]
MELNESSLIINELTLRDLRITKEVTETRRSIVRWLALAIGIISPGESRLTAVSVLDALLYFQFSKRKDPTVGEMSEYIAKSWGAVNEKTLRYHLLQLKKANVLNNSKGKYFLVAPDMGDRYDPDLWIGNYLDSQVNPIKGKLKIAIRELRSR